jgi:hypothetical protein
VRPAGSAKKASRVPQKYRWARESGCGKLLSKFADRPFLDERARSLRDEGVEVGDAHLGLGDPDKEIVKFAEDAHADLIVLGSRGLGRLRRALLGSVSDSVVRHAHCPVLVVRQGPTHESLVRPSTQLG